MNTATAKLGSCIQPPKIKMFNIRSFVEKVDQSLVLIYSWTCILLHEFQNHFVNIPSSKLLIVRNRNWFQINTEMNFIGKDIRELTKSERRLEKQVQKMGRNHGRPDNREGYTAAESLVRTPPGCCHRECSCKPSLHHPTTHTSFRVPERRMLCPS